MDVSSTQSGRRVDIGRAALTAGLVLAALAGGVAIGWGVLPAPQGAGDRSAGDADQVWTCSMHPQVRRSGPGLCPICKMDLEPLSQVARTAAGVEHNRLTPAAEALLKVRTATARRQQVTKPIRLLGQVEYDETRLATITARFGGRLDRLFVDYTGMAVNEGDHLAEMYSPEMLAAQAELLTSYESVQRLAPDAPEMLRESVQATYQAARQKLRLLDFTPEQIDAIIERGSARQRLTIRAPQSGVVIERHASEGQYVQTGSTLYTIADISEVWVLLDAYESDLPWIRYGQAVQFTTEAYPGRRFQGRIAFIDPLLSERTRTIGVRVNAPNPDGALKPGMFVRALVKSQLAAGPKVVAPELAGKWISPMHPEIIKDQPGFCDVCGMPLVRAERLGYVPAAANAAAPPLVVPASAVLRTGTRAVVYVQHRDLDEGPSYEMRQVKLGPRAGSWQIVQAGLSAGERVVTHGQFMIDSERQIRDLPSLLRPGGRPAAAAESAGPIAPDANAAPADAPAAAAEPEHPARAGLLEAYFAAAKALAGDDANAAAAALNRARDLAGRWAASTEGPAHTRAEAISDRLAEMTAKPAEAELGPLRKQFTLLSDQLAELLAADPPRGRPIYRMHCPMAFGNRGADWLQRDRKVQNPYYGASMLRCGSVVEAYRPPGGGSPPEHDH